MVRYGFVQNCIKGIADNRWRILGCHVKYSSRVGPGIMENGAGCNFSRRNRIPLVPFRVVLVVGAFMVCRIIGMQTNLHLHLPSTDTVLSGIESKRLVGKIGC